jgi:hypothetical protein
MTNAIAVTGLSTDEDAKPATGSAAALAPGPADLGLRAPTDSGVLSGPPLGFVARLLAGGALGTQAARRAAPEAALTQEVPIRAERFHLGARSARGTTAPRAPHGRATGSRALAARHVDARCVVRRPGRRGLHDGGRDRAVCRDVGRGRRRAASRACGRRPCLARSATGAYDRGALGGAGESRWGQGNAARWSSVRRCGTPLATRARVAPRSTRSSRQCSPRTRTVLMVPCRRARAPRGV